MTFDMPPVKDPERPAIADAFNGTSANMTFDGDGRLPLGVARASDIWQPMLAGSGMDRRQARRKRQQHADGGTSKDPENGNILSAASRV